MNEISTASNILSVTELPHPSEKNTTVTILAMAAQALKEEAEAVASLCEKLTSDFSFTVNLILESKGRVVITGIGKSAIVANKIVATLNSTGTPSIFMHAADAIHGDLGIIQKDDVVICISKSGNTPEIKVLVPLLKSAGNKLVGMSGTPGSYLAVQSDFVLDCSVDKEACPNNLAPTSSTTAQMALGDALAVALLKCRNFGSADFAKYHPGGSLGKKLYLKVADLTALHDKPFVSPDTSIKDVIIEISRKRLGAAAVVEDGMVKGVITDGDIRRMLEKHSDISSLIAKDIMNPNPKTIDCTEMAVNAVEVIQKNNITQLLVTENGFYAGFVHMHDLLKEGLL